MKKNDWILLVSVLCYSYLFYEQFAGINFLVFNFILLAGLFLRDDQFWKHKSAWLPLIGSVVSAVCIVLYGDELSVFANVCSLGLVASKVLNPNNSFFTALIHAAYSFVSAPINLIIDAIYRSRKNQEERVGQKRTGVLFYLIPVIVSLLFFIFYRNSSSLFKNLTDQIQIDFISFEWIFFTLGGLILLYGFYYNKQILLLLGFEQMQKDGIAQTSINVFKLLGNTIDIDTERKSGTIMFAMLNVLILIVNILDIQFLFLGSSLPEGMTYSELVHQGIGSLIMSIVVAIAIILWYFRGEQNFSVSNTLKLLAFIWIAQNIWMIGSNVYKNILYIDDSALTYKRIGVFIYLLLATIGLITTSVKIKNIKSNWYLLKVNIVSGYCVLILGCLVNWDLCIVRYNINQSAFKNRGLDVEYLASLSHSVIPDLYKWIHNHPDTNDSYAHIKERMNDRILKIVDEQYLVDWRSWSVERNRMTSEIDNMFEQNIIDSIKLNYADQTIPHANKLRILTIENYANSNTWINQLGRFESVEDLNLMNNNLQSIQGMPHFARIKTLNLMGNSIQVMAPVTGCSSLEELDASYNNIDFLPDLKSLTNLKTLNLHSNRIQNIEPLRSLDNLEYLDLSNNNIRDFTPLKDLPKLKTLKIINITDSQSVELQKMIPNVHIN